MDLLEYQGKELFRGRGIPVPDGGVAASPEQAARVARRLGGPAILKAQVPVGGRGKAGGIRRVEDPQDAHEVAAELLTLEISGFTVNEVMVEEAAPTGREFYLAIVLDRSRAAPLILFSPMGGMDIEQVAAEHPEAVRRLEIDPLIGLQPFQSRELLFWGGLDQGLRRSFTDLIERTYGLFRDFDAGLVEINPLLVTEHRVLALDAKVVIDDSALYRQPEVAAFGPPATEDPREQRAKKEGLAYVRLDGNLGILGNGAGLVMATLDLVAQAGGRPANFLDVGGGARAEQIIAALEIITDQPDVRAVLVNVFGGITRCDEVARGLLAVRDRIPAGLPLVVRFEGTRANEGREILAREQLTVAAGLEEAARKAVELAGIPV